MYHGLTVVITFPVKFLSIDSIFSSMEAKSIVFSHLNSHSQNKIRSLGRANDLYVRADNPCVSFHLCSGSVQTTDGHSNPELQQLIDGVPDLIDAGRATKTKEKYQRAWSKWTEFCNNFNITPLPASPFDIAVYFNYLLTTRGTRGCITDAMYGIRWGHIRAGVLPPTDHPFTKLAFDGAIRLSNFSGTKKKEPFTACMLQSLIDLNQLDDRIYFRFVIICVLGFTGFMRLDELLNLKVGQIQFHEKHMAITIPKCKNDQSREGNIIHIAELNSKYCPVLNTAMFIHSLGLLPEHYLVCKLARTKSGHNPIGSYKMSDSYVRKHFKNLVSLHLPEAENISPHSLRSGGASAAAENGVPDRMISKHGRWKSEGARNGYIKDSLCNRLSVSKNLGL